MGLRFCRCFVEILSHYLFTQALFQQGPTAAVVRGPAEPPFHGLVAPVLVANPGRPKRFQGVERRSVGGEQVIWRKQGTIESRSTEDEAAFGTADPERYAPRHPTFPVFLEPKIYASHGLPVEVLGLGQLPHHVYIIEL